MSSLTINKYVKIFKSSKRQNKTPFPYLIFIEVNSINIINNIKSSKYGKISIFELRMKLKEEWTNLTKEEKKDYELAAIELGYVAPSYKSKV